jgi:hypothetical protein
MFHTNAVQRKETYFMSSPFIMKSCVFRSNGKQALRYAWTHQVHIQHQTISYNYRGSSNIFPKS